MSGCSLPIDTPFENIDAMMDTVAELGYPFTLEKLNQMIIATEKEIRGI